MTIIEQKKKEEEEEILELEKQKKFEERKQETKDLLKQELEKRKEAEVQKVQENEESEEENEAAAYEKWTLRELARIKRDQKEREEVDKEKKEIERRRKLSDRDIMKEDADKLAPRPKSKWNYLQKYYHEGAFFRSQDESDISSNHDFNQPTGEDKIDKSILPQVMQVKDWGKTGRTKWTHLTNEDTTNWDAPWAQKDIYKPLGKRLAGTGEVSRPSKKKK